MSLDFSLHVVRRTEVFSSNITHNLGKMANAAGIYECLWCPYAAGIAYAKEMIDPLKKGIEALKANPERFKEFDAKNGWGTYEQFVPWVESVLKACEENPDAEVSADV